MPTRGSHTCSRWGFRWGSVNTATHIVAPICWCKTFIIMLPVSSNAWGSLRERGGGGDGHLFRIVLLAGVGLNSSGDPGRGSSSWGSVWEEQPELAVSAPQRWHQLLKLPTPWETNYGPGDLHRGTHPDHLSRKRSRFHFMNSYSFLEKGNHFLHAIANLLFLFCSYKWFFFFSLRLWGMYL